ncbi:MAG TPA: sulfotransferase [Steroidobacteraceae bacterium]|nr:sulfotransferase [Steroidobacteraceae bacterium]
MMRGFAPETPVHGQHVAFLVGAGRSGTTLLYKLLCLHPQVAYISNYENRLGWFPEGLATGAVSRRLDAKLHAWFNRGGNAYFIDRPWLKKLFPTPNEGESVFRASGVPLFPQPGDLPDRATAERLRKRFERMRTRAHAAVFLSKRTANNRRIPYLSAIFPAARYVHLVRDGREVTQSLSTVEWWDGHTVWWDGRTPVEMERSGESRLAICARNWVRELEELRAQLQAVPAGHLLELRFEELLREPIAQLERVVRFLGLEFTPQYRAAIASLQLRPVRARWGSEWDDRQLECVLREARPMLRQLGYTE